jgi:hypothetical protein
MTVTFTPRTVNRSWSMPEIGPRTKLRAAIWLALPVMPPASLSPSTSTIMPSFKSTLRPPASSSSVMLASLSSILTPFTMMLPKPLIGPLNAAPVPPLPTPAVVAKPPPPPPPQATRITARKMATASQR